MAKVSMVEREKKKISTVAKYAKKRADIMAKLNDATLSDEEKWEYRIKLQKLPRNASPSRVQRRCRVTGRPHSVIRKFGLCRNKLREMSMKGEIPGIVKASW